jgi:hypothetical protein
VDGISYTVHPWVPNSRPIGHVRSGLGASQERLPRQARVARQPVAAVVRWLGRSGSLLTSPATAASGEAIAIRQVRDSVGILHPLGVPSSFVPVPRALDARPPGLEETRSCARWNWCGNSGEQCPERVAAAVLLPARQDVSRRRRTRASGCLSLSGCDPRHAAAASQQQPLVG